jgi:hypothetical protein
MRCNAEGGPPVNGPAHSLIGPGAMPTADELRAKAMHYRAMIQRTTDTRSLEAIQELASELDRKADALEKNSAAIYLRIPTQVSRRFRSIPAGDSDGSQPLIPMHSSHP